MSAFKRGGEWYHLVNTLTHFDQVCEELLKAPLVGSDTETTSLRFYEGHIIGFSFSLPQKNKNYYIPIRHETDELQCDEDYVLDRLNEVFSRKDLTTVWHNLTFDKIFLLNEGIELACRCEDTLLLSFLYDENISHKLDNLAPKFLGVPKWKDVIKERIRERAKELKCKIGDLNYSHVDIETMTIYAGRDTNYTLRLYPLFKKAIEEGDFGEIYEYELEMVNLVVDMMWEGVYIDSDYLNKLKKKLEVKLAKIEGRLNRITAKAYKNKKKKLNPRSPKQINELFDALKIPVIKMTKTGKNRSVDNQVLARLEGRYTVAKILREYRKNEKLYGTYVKGLLGLVTDEGKIHTTYNVTGARTGRLSSNDPNLQNQPSGPIIRSAFICPDEFVMIFIDFSQIELRLAAHFSQEPNMLDVYAVDGDLHQQMADKIGSTRKDGKTVNFGFLYGMGPRKFREDCFSKYGVEYTEKQAQHFFHVYWNVAYPKLKRWVAQETQNIVRYGYMDNYFGRRRRIPEVHDRTKPKWMKEHAIRGGVNFKIQGTAADVFKRASVKVNRFLKERNAKTCPVLSVHDEMGFYWHKSELDLLPDVVDLMEDYTTFSVPLKVGLAYSSKSWGKKKDLEL